MIIGAGMMLLAACSPALHAPPAAQGGSPAMSSPMASASPVASASTASAPAPPSSNWVLTWSDEFNSTADLRNWNYVTDGNGGYLKQLQWYDSTNATINVQGDLVITASKDGGVHQCWYGPCQYKSVRMNTLGFFAQKYGRFEARIKFPPGRGLWPAFWLEGDNIGAVGWPAAGEVDIVEPDGKHPTMVESYAHGPNHFRVRNEYPMGASITRGFHVYGIDWSPKGITWWVDGHPYGYAKHHTGWVFDHPFFIILDLAVGGGYSGPPNSATPFPGHMLVDWIRVYRAR